MRDLRLLWPFGVWLIVSLFLPDNTLVRQWSATIHVAGASVTLLPWFRRRVMPDASWPRLVGLQALAVAATAALEGFDKWQASPFPVDTLSLVAGVVLLVFLFRAARHTKHRAGTTD